MSVTELPKLYTDAEAAAILRCKPATVGRLRRARKLGYTFVGRTPYITDKHIAAYLEAQECAAISSKEAGTGSGVRIQHGLMESGTSGGTTTQLDDAASTALVYEIIARHRKRSPRSSSPTPGSSGSNPPSSST